MAVGLGARNQFIIQSRVMNWSVASRVDDPAAPVPLCRFHCWYDTRTYLLASRFCNSCFECGRHTRNVYQSARTETRDLSALVRAIQ